VHVADDVEVGLGEDGAPGSLLMAMIVPESFMPTRCCIAQEIPQAP
jgi:hypothetical protein